MIDIRYHIYSLAAVFFALAVGIVVGTSFANRTPVNDRGKRTITRYESSMRNLRSQIEQVADEGQRQEEMANSSEEFCQAVLPLVAQNRLQWRNVAIVQTGDFDDLSGHVKRTLELAGAKVTSITDIDRDFSFADGKKISEALAACGVPTDGDAKLEREKLFSLITEIVCSAGPTGLLSQLEDSGVGKFTGEYDNINKLVVLVGGSQSKKIQSAEDVDSQLIAQMEKRNITVVGCESTKAAGSFVPLWHKMGIATVDNADSAIGQIAVIFALNGENAQFGIKDTAERLIPKTLESK